MKSNSGKLMIFLVAMLFLLVLNYSPPVAAVDNSIKILLLGDSITQADSDRASYRYPLWKRLVDAGIDFDFVGSMNKNLGSGKPPQPDYKGLKFDPDHEGHFAWTTDEIISGREFDDGSGSGNLKSWLESYDVDLALIHLGTNDAFLRQSNQSTAAELKAIVSLIRDDNPRVIILLAQLIPTTYAPSDSKSIISLNKTIAALSKTLGTEKSPVILVDQFTGFDGRADLHDRVHPNASGEEKMAARWYDAIQDAVKE